MGGLSVPTLQDCLPICRGSTPASWILSHINARKLVTQFHMAATEGSPYVCYTINVFRCLFSRLMAVTPTAASMTASADVL